MEILIYFGVIVGISVVIQIITFLQKKWKNLLLKKLLRNNKEILEKIDFGKFNENIQIYQDFVSNNNLKQNIKLPEPKLINEDLTKCFFLSSLYNKYKFNNEILKDVLFK